MKTQKFITHWKMTNSPWFNLAIFFSQVFINNVFFRVWLFYQHLYKRYFFYYEVEKDWRGSQSCCLHVRFQSTHIKYILKKIKTKSQIIDETNSILPSYISFFTLRTKLVWLFLIMACTRVQHMWGLSRKE